MPRYEIHLTGGGHVAGGQVDVKMYDEAEPRRARSDAELKDLESLALQLMGQFGLRPDPWGSDTVPDAKRGRWTFGWDRATKRRGQTNYSARRISHSRVHAEHISMRSFVETILHEIAHALVGPGHGHNEVWRDVARAIGDSGERTYADRPAALMAATAPPYVGTCSNCGRESRKHRRNKVACGACCLVYAHGRFDERFLLTWRRA